jgi:hypothetical protein
MVLHLQNGAAAATVAAPAECAALAAFCRRSSPSRNPGGVASQLPPAGPTRSPLPSSPPPPSPSGAARLPLVPSPLSSQSTPTAASGRRGRRPGAARLQIEAAAEEHDPTVADRGPSGASSIRSAEVRGERRASTDGRRAVRRRLRRRGTATTSAAASSIRRMRVNALPPPSVALGRLRAPRSAAPCSSASAPAGGAGRGRASQIRESRRSRPATRRRSMPTTSSLSGLGGGAGRRSRGGRGAGAATCGPRRRQRPPSRAPPPPDARGSQLPRGDARGDARDCCGSSSFARGEHLHPWRFCICASGYSWRPS